MFALGQQCYAGYRGKDAATPQARPNRSPARRRIAPVIVACACGVAAERFRTIRTKLCHELCILSVHVHRQTLGWNGKIDIDMERQKSMWHLEE
jgi:hypothetical protein